MMQSITLKLPRPVPLQRIRPPKSNIPFTPQERMQILQSTRNYVAEFNPVPPMPSSELLKHADKVVEMLQCPSAYREYISVLINNEMWRESLAAVPFNRRLLLLPKCLRDEKKCPAPFDEFGLLCKGCGLCSIHDLQGQAEKLGYAVLVAEGSATVMSLIQAGKIEAIIGVSCMGVLERAFPYMEAAAIPGVAIPLLQDDCVSTNVDLDWVWDYIHLTSSDQTRRMDLGALREEIDSWFTPDSLDQIMGEACGQTELIARNWLGRAGKRWRPFLAVASFQALQPDQSAPLPVELKKIAIAVECFHKASLIHDDIEDNDSLRYGEKTLHEEHGVAVALNAGDLLIGEGYRMIGSANIPAEQKARMLLAAGEAQRALCRGQGAELCWTRKPETLSTLQVLDIFRQKTAPAFEVALRLGTLFHSVEKHDEAAKVISTYCEALGIAYQIRDDLSDLETGNAVNDIQALRPSLVLAIACQRAQGKDREILESVWHRTRPVEFSAADIESLCNELKAQDRARHLLETYKEEAVRALSELENPNLKGLLRRVIGKIFNEVEIKGWCKEVGRGRAMAGNDKNGEG